MWLARFVAVGLALGSAYMWTAERVVGRIEGPGLEIELTGAILAALAWVLSLRLERRSASSKDA